MSNQAHCRAFYLDSDPCRSKIVTVADYTVVLRRKGETFQPAVNWALNYALISTERSEHR